MNALRLTIRFIICVVGLPLLAAFVGVALIEWACTERGEVFDLCVRPWLRCLRHPLT